MNWKFFARMALPMLEMVAQQYRDKDENDTGKDDMIGIAIQFAVDIIEAVINGTPIPKAPEALK